MVLSVFTLWLLISSICISKNSIVLENIFIFIIFILSSYLLFKSALIINNFNSIIKIFAVSLIFSASLVILDSFMNWGLKIWLSQNLDSSNFKNFYSLKSWTSLEVFQKNNLLVINKYMDNTYDRGIAGIAILALPVSRICYQFNYKILATLVMFMSLILISLGYNKAALFSYLIVIILAVLFFYKKRIFYKIFILLFGSYFFFIPLVLGPADFRQLNNIEDSNTAKVAFAKKKLVLINYCTKLNSFISYFDGGIIGPNKDIILQKYKDYLYKDFQPISKTSKDNANIKSNKVCKKINSFTISKKYLTATSTIIKYHALKFKEHINHRMVIWSFVKIQIFEKPLFGHGFFSSKTVGEKYQFTNINSFPPVSMNIMPLHPHNGIMQIWLELGLLGVLILFTFVYFLIRKIHKHAKINFTNGAFAMISLCQIFFIGQLSYGVWQTWWLSLVAYNFILYGFLFNYKKPRLD